MIRTFIYWTVWSTFVIWAGLVFFFLIIRPSPAQQQPKPYVPFVVDEQSYAAIHTYLDQQPAMFSRRLLEWMEGQEIKAQNEVAEKEKAEKDKAAKQ